MTSLDLSDDTREHRRGGRKGVAFVALLVIVGVTALGTNLNLFYDSISNLPSSGS